ncbi:hypothetical protein [Streptomyces alkaliterrae]|uniref:Tetratricopeptide repeat protein n=1 Tax=Streptomyces alkaliterrae TaxID=2213162 RepID=A0A5P0YK44_9ACTN|nr:hypothetical protein [Streptomyces alkaliterrae]MBB1257361.1 hypothetical protein [Streptomyces alkaliterrae]MQS00744.1 hypothetical protein [Streptomyces alkaliterrae]
MTDPPRPAPDRLATRIGQAVILHRAGDREEARSRLAALWAELQGGPAAQGDPAVPGGPAVGGALARCTVAHYLAGTQEDPYTRLQWHLRALSAARGHREPADGRSEEPSPAMRALYPLLCLGLADGYAELGERAAARRELARARAALAALPDEGRRADLQAAADRLARRLDP